MSRHKKAYDEDDLYYDDDYDNYDDFPPRPPPPSTKKQPKPTPNKSNQKNSQPMVSPGAGKVAAVNNNAKSPASEQKQTTSLKIEPVANAIEAEISDDEGTISPPPGKSRLTLVVAGHVDAGKSTLIGNLLYLGGKIGQRTIAKFQKQSQESGKGSFAYAWVMDESQSEREHGVTIDIAERQFETPNHIFTILDAPGHKDYVPHLLTGAAHAHVAILVVPAAVGEYESSMSVNAQTREHAMILKALGIKQVVIAVNKMDLTIPPWSRDRFNSIDSEIRELLSSLRFNLSCVRTVPVAGLGGVNMVSTGNANSPTLPAELSTWYNGPTLSEAMDALRPLETAVRGSSVSNSFRGIITSSGVLGSGGAGGGSSGHFSISVVVLRGTLAVGRSVGIAGAVGAGLTDSNLSEGHHPHKLATFVVSKLTDEEGTVVSAPEIGRQVVVTLTERNKHHPILDECCLRSGMIVFKGPPHVRSCRQFQATILTVTDLATPLICGTSLELYVHGEEAECMIDQIISTLSSDSHVQQFPKWIGAGCTSIVNILCDRWVGLETFSQCAGLARIALRLQGKTVAIGMCSGIDG